jgi:predicted metal-dependent hydrolase
MAPRLTNQTVKIDHLIRSNRKTIALEVNHAGELIVRAPRFATNSQIQDLVQEKARWINEKQFQAQKRKLDNPSKKFHPGEQFLYLGASYPLVIVSDQEERLVLKDAFYLVKKAFPQAKSVFENWYRRHAKVVINERAHMYAQQDGFRYSRLRISNAKTRWGSCGAKGSLNFSWRIVMAPMRIIDYVIVHELVHLKDRSHSRRYWRQVESLLPDYQQQVNWLKENGHLLSID